MPENNKKGRRGNSNRAQVVYTRWLARRPLVEKELQDYVFSLTWDTQQPHLMDESNPNDAVNECKHEWLPTDKKKDCDCW